MRKTKAFVLVKELCGDAFFLANASPQEVYINAAIEGIDSLISIINYFMVKKNGKERMEIEDAKIVAAAETYCIKLSQETEEMRWKFTAAKDVADWQQEKYHVLMENIQETAKKLKETVEFVKQWKKVLSRTEEDIKENQQHIAFLDDWIRKSTKQYINLINYYQIGDEEDE